MAGDYAKLPKSKETGWQFKHKSRAICPACCRNELKVVDKGASRHKLMIISGGLTTLGNDTTVLYLLADA